MRILLVTRLSPFPPMGGVPLRTAANIRALAELGPVDVIVIGDQSREEPPSYVASVEHFSVPKPDRVAKTLRRFGLRHPLADELHLPEVEAAIARLGTGPGLIVLEEVWLAPYLDAARQTSRSVIYDSHNVETILRRQIADTAGLGSARRMRAKMIGAQVERLEQPLVTMTDQTWACSDADCKELRRLFGAELDVHMVPNAANVEEIRDQVDQAHQQQPPTGVGSLDKSVIYLGDLGYAPNDNGAIFLLEEVMPELRELVPDAAPVFVGRRPTERLVRKAASLPNAVVTGEVDSVAPYLAHGKVLAVTLLTGGGTRLKIVEAMAAGLPIVTTTKGLEGIDAIHREHVLIADTPAELATAIAEVLDNPAKAAQMAERARHLVIESYSWGTVADLVKDATGGLKI